MKKNPSNIPVTRKSLFFWAFKGNIKVQILLLFLIIGMVFFRVIPLEMQKRIINEAIVLHKLDSLLLYCGIYIAAVTLTSIIKLATNYIQASIGERAILNMRAELYEHIIALPLHFFRNTQPGMVVSSLMTELNTAGTFAGMALSVLFSNIITLLAFAGYLLWLNSKLALATLGIYPVVVFLIPWIQKKTNRLNKQRVDQSRLVASQIAESITGITEIHVHGAYVQEKQKFNKLVEALQRIRIKWSLLRFGTKSLNNYFVSLGPFVVFLFGGYLTINGQLELGALVAFLSAQEKLYDPWKELIEYYQVYQDASIRYHRVMEYFDLPVGNIPLITMAPEEKLAGPIKVSNLWYTAANGVSLLKGVSFSLKAGEHLALVGFSGSGKSTLVHCVAKMFDYSSGSITLNTHEIKDLSKNDIIQHVGYISQNPFIVSGSIRENLLYAHRAATTAALSAEVDYQQPDRDHLILALQQAGFFVDVIRFGLNTSLDPSDTEMIAKIIRIREQFRENARQTLEEHIEFYRMDHYLQHASIAENIIFSTPQTGSFSISATPQDPQLTDFLKEISLENTLILLGIDLAKHALETFPGHDSSLSSQMPLIPPEKIENYRILLNHLENEKTENITTAEHNSFLSLSLQYIEAKHKLVTLPSELKKKIVSCRKKWQKRTKKTAASTYIPYQKTAYIHTQSILNNILFGRIQSEQSSVQEKINQSIIRLLIEEDCLESIVELGMDYHLGSMGNQLSGGQKQKLSIARVLLKTPEIILMDEATSALDNKSQARIQHLIEQRWRNTRTIIAVVHRLDIIQGFDKIGVMKEGKLMEFGTYDELIQNKGLLHELVMGKG